MKKLYIIVLCLLSYSATFAQKYMPVIKQDTKINYNVSSRASGATAAITLTMLHLTDTVKINWQVPFVGSGNYEIPPAAMRSGTKIVTREPKTDEITLLKNNETLIFLSADAFKSLVNDKKFELDGHTFYVKTDTASYKINDKPADVFYAATVKNDKELWILNNPALPLICRSRKAAKALDFYLVSILNN